MVNLWLWWVRILMMMGRKLMSMVRDYHRWWRCEVSFGDLLRTEGVMQTCWYSFVAIQHLIETDEIIRVFTSEASAVLCSDCLVSIRVGRLIIYIEKYLGLCVIRYCDLKRASCRDFCIELKIDEILFFFRLSFYLHFRLLYLKLLWRCFDFLCRLASLLRLYLFNW